MTKMNEPKHTPNNLPWKVVKPSFSVAGEPTTYSIEGPDSDWMAISSLEEAEYIVRACNAFPAMEARIAEMEAENESMQEEFRNICILIGFDPSEGEGTTPAEVVESVKGELEYLKTKWGEAESALAKAQPEEGK